MTEYKYDTDLQLDGLHLTVTRLKDGATKVFYQANVKTPEALVNFCKFMDSITDELAEGYWPREKKVKK